MKKIISLLVAFLMVTNALAVFATELSKVTIEEAPSAHSKFIFLELNGKKVVAPGEEYEVVVKLDSSFEILNLAGFILKYDKNLFEFVSATPNHELYNYKVLDEGLMISTIYNRSYYGSFVRVKFIAKSSDEGLKTANFQCVADLSETTGFLDEEYLIIDNSHIDFGEALSVNVVQVIGGTCGENVNWDLDIAADTLTISGSGEIESYIIEFPPWYEFKDEISKVVIENGVTTIGSCAFVECENLVSVKIPYSTTEIGEEAFAGCTSLNFVEMPNSVEKIGMSAFANCYSLTNIVLPEKINKISYGIFSGCTGLKTIKIPYGVTTIGAYAFSECENLVYLNIPDSVTYISYGTFADCNSLTDIYYNGSEGQWNSIQIGEYNDELLNANIHFLPKVVASGTCGDKLTWEFYDNGTLTIRGIGGMYDYSDKSPAPWNNYKDSIKNVVIENGVVYIGNCAFYKCTELVNASISGSVESIGISAFDNCIKLENLSLAEGIKYIDYYAFYSCEKLKKIILPSSLETIGKQAFHNLRSLESIRIPQNVNKITEKAFSFCLNLKEINVDENNKYYCAVDGNLFTKNKTKLLQYAVGKTSTEYNIPNGVTTIASNAFFAAYNLKNITVPTTVNVIEDNAFVEYDVYGKIVLSDIYYKGTEAEWNSIAIADLNDYITSAKKHFNCKYSTETVKVMYDGVNTSVHYYPNGDYKGNMALCAFYTGNRQVDVGLGTCTDGKIAFSTKQKYDSISLMTFDDLSNIQPMNNATYISYSVLID